MFDQTQDARQLKCLTVVDEFTRQGLTNRLDLLLHPLQSIHAPVRKTHHFALPSHTINADAE